MVENSRPAKGKNKEYGIIAYTHPNTTYINTNIHHIYTFITEHKLNEACETTTT